MATRFTFQCQNNEGVTLLDGYLAFHRFLLKKLVPPGGNAPPIAAYQAAVILFN